MPQAFTGLTFAWLFQSDYGVVNDLFGRVGLNTLFAALLPSNLVGADGVLWLARPVTAVVAANLAIIWKTSSFVGLILLAGLQSIDESSVRGRGGGRGERVAKVLAYHLASTKTPPSPSRSFSARSPPFRPLTSPLP